MSGLVFSISNLVVGLTCLILVFILLKYGSKRIHYVAALFNLVTGIWGFGGFLIGLAKDSTTAMVAWKIGLAGAIPSPAVLYHLVTTLGELNRKKVSSIFYMYSLIFYCLTFFNLIGLKPVYVHNSFYFVNATDFRFWFFVTIWIGIIFYSIFELYKLFNKSSGHRKLQYQYLMIAFVIGWTGAILDAFQMVGVNIFPANNILIWFYCILVTYAILRHQLLEIEVIVKKTLVFAGLLASVFAMLVLPTLVIQEYIFRGAGFGGRMIGLAISGIIIILSLRRIENFLINVTDKYLFQKKYNYKELLKTFTSEVLTVLDLNRLVTLTVDKLSDIIKLQSCGILLLDKDKNEYVLAASQGIKDENISLKQDNTLTSFLTRTRTYLSVKTQGKDLAMPKDILEDMNKLKFELAIPLMTLQGDMLGILTLGKKKSDEDYTQDDMDILLPLARTLAIAISNAEMFDELGKTQAEAAQREKMAVIGTLSAGMAHEIRNPLTTIKTFTEFVREKKDNPEFLEKFEHLVPREIEKINHMIEHLLEFSRPADYKSMELANLKEALKEPVEILGNEMVLNDIILEEVIPPDISVWGNKKYIQEIVFNLMQNSIAAIGRKGKITLKAETAGGRIELSIKDTGCGISKENMQHIFEPFFTTKVSEKGVGLGLYVIRQLMTRMSGSIEADSEVGKGTEFKLVFAKEEVK